MKLYLVPRPGRSTMSPPSARNKWSTVSMKDDNKGVVEDFKGCYFNKLAILGNYYNMRATMASLIIREHFRDV